MELYLKKENKGWNDEKNTKKLWKIIKIDNFNLWFKNKRRRIWNLTKVKFREELEEFMICHKTYVEEWKTPQYIE